MTTAPTSQTMLYMTLSLSSPPSTAARRVGRDQLAKRAVALAFCHNKDVLHCASYGLSANACLAGTPRESLVRAGCNATFSPVTAYVCTVAFNALPPMRKTAVPAPSVGRASQAGTERACR